MTTIDFSEDELNALMQLLDIGVTLVFFLLQWMKGLDTREMVILELGLDFFYCKHIIYAYD